MSACTKRSIVVFGVLLALVTMPAAAQASDFCVGVSPNCAIAPYAFDSSGLQAALNAAEAQAGADRVVIASGTLPITTNIALTASHKLDVVGAGTSATNLQRGDGDDTALALTFLGSGTISHLSLSQTGLPTGTPVLLRLSGGTAFDIRAADKSSAGISAIGLASNASLEDSTVTVEGGNDTAINATSGSVNIRRSTAIGQAATNSYGMNLSGMGVSFTIERSKFTNFARALSIDSGSLVLTDSLIDMGTKSSANGVYALNDNTGTLPINATVRRVTIIGSGANQRALRVGADSPSETFTGQVDDTLLRTTGSGGADIICSSGASVAPSINTDHSAFDSTRVVPALCNFGHTSQTDTSASAPLFVNASASDFRPTYDSPLVDAGSGGGMLGANAVDLDGWYRLVDGDGDGTAAVDIGAFEYQRWAPSIAGVSPNPAYGARNEPLTFNAIVSDQEQEPTTVKWAFDDGAIAIGPTATHAFATSGEHHVTVTATDASGASHTATSTARIANWGVDERSLTVIVKPRRSFRRNGRPFQKGLKANQPFIGLHGAAAGKTKFTLDRKTKGIFRSGKCRRGLGRPACTRYVKVKGVGNFTMYDSDFVLTFGGTFNGKLLPRGTYRLTMVPSGGTTAGKPVRVIFSLR